jgi:hypothetical protein
MAHFRNGCTQWFTPRFAAQAAVGLLVAAGVLHLAQGQTIRPASGRSASEPARQARSQTGQGASSSPSATAAPEAEFHMARMIYSSGDGRRAFRPWWAIDYPEAEYHFRQGVQRLTRIDMADDSRHIPLTDDALFDYPWLFAQQVGRWSLSDAETSRLRQYLLRGGQIEIYPEGSPPRWRASTTTTSA